MKHLVLTCLLISIAYSNQYNLCKYNMTRYWLNEVFVDKSYKLDSIISNFGFIKSNQYYKYQNDSIIEMTQEFTNYVLTRDDTTVYVRNGNLFKNIFNTGGFYFDSIQYSDTLISSTHGFTGHTPYSYFADSIVVDSIAGVFDGSEFSTPLLDGSGIQYCVFDEDKCACAGDQHYTDSVEIIATNYGWNELRYENGELALDWKYYMQQEELVSVNQLSSQSQKIINDNGVLRLSSNEVFFYQIYNLNGQLLFASDQMVKEVKLEKIRVGNYLILKTANESMRYFNNK